MLVSGLKRKSLCLNSEILLYSWLWSSIHFVFVEKTTRWLQSLKLGTTLFYHTTELFSVRTARIWSGQRKVTIFERNFCWLLGIPKKFVGWVQFSSFPSLIPEHGAVVDERKLNLCGRITIKHALVVNVFRMEPGCVNALNTLLSMGSI